MLTSLPPHAMVNNNGDLFYPDDGEDARHFATEHDAWPVLPQSFPWVSLPLLSDRMARE